MRTSTLSAAALAVAIALPSAALAQGRIIILNNNAPGVGFNDPAPAAPVGGNTATTRGAQRLAVFEYAAAIWTAVLNPRADIVVRAQFTPLGPNVLGSAGALWVESDFPGAEYPGTWYQGALANHLAGTDLNPDSPEITVNFSTNFAFYLGLDNNEPANQQDLLAVALHEIGHGLGFANFVTETTGAQFLNQPDIYSQYTRDVQVDKSWVQMTNAERAASALNLRKVSWDGVNVNRDVPKVLSPGEPFLRATTAAGSTVYLFGTASFGAPLTPAGVSGELVVGIDGLDPAIADTSTTNGCTPLVNPVAGKIVLMDRGVCGFTVKVKNAQDAGAIGVVIADNVAGGPPPGLGGADPTITIPSGRVTLTDGNALKAALAAGSVNASFGLDLSVIAGTDRIKGLALLATLDPVALGSSISHFDAVASRNLLMEPAINSDLTASVTPPEDLTTSLMTDIGWYSDGDGVPDGRDSCIGSDTRNTVVLGACDSGVANTIFGDGCSIADRLGECELDADTHGEYVACVSGKTNDWNARGVLSGRAKGAIQSCAAKNK